MGDFFWRNTLPNLIHATTKLWIDTLNALIKSYPDYTFIPGHGDIGNLQEVVAFRDYLSMLRTQVAAAQAQGKTGNELIKSVLPGMTEKYSGWDFFNLMAESNIREVSSELSGTKTVPR